jgi:hypothetical protein
MSRDDREPARDCVIDNRGQSRLGISQSNFAPSIDEAARQLVDERIAERATGEGDDLAWAKPYVDRARAAVARGDVLTLMSTKPATQPALQPSRVDDSGRCRGRCNPMNSAGAVASGIVIARKPIECLTRGSKSVHS